MIGLYRPIISLLSNDEHGQVKLIHCCGCNILKSKINRISTLVCPYETDLLVYIILGLGYQGNKEIMRIRCSAFPLIKKNIYSFPTIENEILSAFSTIVVFAFLDDHLRDENSLKGKIFIRYFEDQLDRSLELLNIVPNTNNDPRLLATIKEENIKTIEEYISIYSTFIEPIWSKSISLFCPTVSENRIKSISSCLYRIMILSDMLIDHKIDKIKGNFNLIKDFDNYLQIKEKIESAQTELMLLVSNFASPWKNIIINIIKRTISITKRQEYYYD